MKTLRAVGFLAVVIASAFLDGEAWIGAVIAILIGTAMMIAPEAARRARA